MGRNETSNDKHGVELIVTRIKEPTLVQPNEETKKGLRFLTNLDQFPHVVRMIYCFKSQEKGNENVVDVIKDALSKILVHYYPVAGRLTTSSKMKFILDCTNEGAVFVEAEANCNIEVISEKISDQGILDPVILDKLVYNIPDAKTILDNPPLVVQVTKFKCGGFVVGTGVNHIVFDGRSAMEFLNSWGRTARGLPLEVKPFLDSTLLKARNPPIVEYSFDEFMDIDDISNTTNLMKEEICYRSFHFSQKDLQNLKNKATTDGGILTCSTFEALAAFVWKARNKALNLKPDQKTKLVIAVDGQSRLEPPLPEGYVGNVIVPGCSICTVGEQFRNPFSFTVKLVHDAVKMVTDSYIRSYIDYLEVPPHRPSMVFTLVIVGSSKVPSHIIDFGWGEPLMPGWGDNPGRYICGFISDGDRMKGMNVLLGLPLSSVNTFEELMKQI